MIAPTYAKPASRIQSAAPPASVPLEKPSVLITRNAWMQTLLWMELARSQTNVPKHVLVIKGHFATDQRKNVGAAQDIRGVPVRRNDKTQNRSKHVA